MRIVVAYSSELIDISSVIGWCYFVAWSISFYPQIYTNFKRKSVVGLNFDFLSLNVVGFVLYAIFNVGLYFIPEIQVRVSWVLNGPHTPSQQKKNKQHFAFHLKRVVSHFLIDNNFIRYLQKEYSERFPRSLNPVQLNDVFFACHATFATFITICQCFAFDVSWTIRQNQHFKTKITHTKKTHNNFCSKSTRLFAISESRSTCVRCCAINFSHIRSCWHFVDRIGCSQSCNLAGFSVYLQLY